MSKKKKKTGGFLSNLLLFICVVIFCTAAWKLWGFYRNYHSGQKEYEKLREYVREDQEGKKEECPVDVDFDALAKVNPDVKAWIYIKGTGINYPVVQTEDNNYYLHHTFEKRDSYIGAIFLDAFCEPEFLSENSIVYGHNLKNGEMFGMLKRYYDTEYNKKADYKKHKKIWIITPKEKIEYQIFAAREIDSENDSDVYTISFASGEEYGNYLENAWEKSLYQTDTKTDVTKRMLTLSTCTSSSENGRFIVQAEEIQREAEGEE